MEKQRTIKRAAVYSGVGLHTGNETTIVFHPAAVNSGIRFVRTDLEFAPEIPCDIDHVIDVARGTTLGNDSVKVHTVEHILAAIAGLSIDNLRIEVNANEPPVADGSSLPFVEKLQEAGVVEQDAPKRYFELKEPVWLSFADDVYLVILPADELKITYTVAYEHPLLKSQFASFVVNNGVFAKEIAPARTFCFLHEVELLREQGLIKGGNLNNAVVIGDDTILNDTLRFDNEFVRHKILDLVGDLYLLGQPIKAHLIVVKSGHASNVKLVQKLRQLAQKPPKEEGRGKREEGRKIIHHPSEAVFLPPSEAVVYRAPLDIRRIQQILPHRYPFLLVDRILELVADKWAVGIKNITANEHFFVGHFPGHPVMPGVLLIEAMAQVAGVLMLSKSDNEGKLAYLLGIDNAKFRKTVVPGDQLRFEVEVKRLKERTGKVQTYAYVEGKVVAEAELTFSLVEA
ncbi:MAG: bifunctional UDP-3-O-[3-hydroxymyristoyl] N-acetylglucosamine deacetylase/3-hydroxyacyl-ACP dehydratase [bacterium]|nr:bifunctional UDP-3-O-[3-hydroxymyristoyl] N-acetylglucosamine deacetylase/3-hydroxyacyl-ACP dehydratase [bacterium]